MRPLVPLVLLLAPAAGCVVEGPSDGPAAPRVFASDLVDCDVAIGLIPVPAARLAPRMPSGWRPLQPEEAGLPDDPRGDALLGIEVASCASGYGGNVTDAPYGSYFTLVEPPEDFRDADARFHFLKWETLVADGAAREALQEAGAAAFEGSASFGPRVPLAEAFQATLEMDGAHLFRATGPAPGDPSLQRFRFVEWQPTRGGFARWEATPVTDGLRVGGVTIEVPPGFARDVAGGPRADGYAIVGRGSFTEATLTVPPP